MTHPSTGAILPRPPDTRGERLLAGLTPEQAHAVRHGRGPLLILAGPGAGKTRTLTHRVAHLLARGQATPREILAVTFSVRAAGELRLRLADLLGERTARGVTAATFHSVCARLLREHAELFGRTDAYTIYDQADMRRVIEWLLADHRRDPIQRALADYGQPPAGELETRISLAKSRLLTPESYTAASRDPAADWSPPSGATATTSSSAATRWRSTTCSSTRCGCCASTRTGSPTCAAAGAGSWSTRSRTPTTPRRTRTAAGRRRRQRDRVGDDDQAIYRFRAAEPRNILAFGERYPRHERVVLGRNFRSRAEILRAAATCVAVNQHRHPKALIAMRGPGGRITTRGFATDRDEAGWVAGLIADALAAGTPPSEVLVLARTGYATGPVQARWPPPGSRTACSARSASTSAPRSATRSPTSLCSPTPSTRRRSAAPSARRGAGSAPPRSPASSPPRASATPAT